jgi:hypothetical protein
LPQKKLGAIVKLNMQAGARTVEFYVHEWGPGILVFFTSSCKEEYEKTLRRFIRFNRGITEMWISPTLFSKVRSHLLEKHEAVIYSFISRRSLLSKTPARLRPDFDRRLSYTGDDGTRVLKEVLDFYGVLPDSISFRVGMDKLQVASNGMLLFRSINKNTIQIMRELLSILTEPQKEFRDVSDALRRDTRTIQVGKMEFRTPVVIPGIIRLHGKRLDRNVIERFFKQETAYAIDDSYEPRMAEDIEPREFSFIGTSIPENALSFSAIVVDDIKGTMFGLSGTSDNMVLVPMHRTTFESFVRFYKLVIENLDEEARFDVLTSKI